MFESACSLSKPRMHGKAANLWQGHFIENWKIDKFICAPLKIKLT